MNSSSFALSENTENDATANQESFIILRDEDLNNLRHFLSEGKESNVNKECNVFNWKDNSTKLLLSLYEKNLPNFNSPNLKKKKTVWQIISSEMKTNNYDVSHIQCENKFKSLYGIYKKIKDNNNASGRGRKTFQYMEEMETLFAKDPTIQPVSQATSTGGFAVLTNDDSPSTSSTPSTSQAETPSRKRKIEEKPGWFKSFRIDSEKRHKERMEAQNKFLSFFEKLIEKM